MDWFHQKNVLNVTGNSTVLKRKAGELALKLK
jgi:hypothetical protein